MEEPKAPTARGTPPAPGWRGRSSGAAERRVAQRLAVALARPREQHEHRQQPMEKARGEVPRAHFLSDSTVPLPQTCACIMSEVEPGAIGSLLGLAVFLVAAAAVATHLGPLGLEGGLVLDGAGAALASAAVLSKRANRSAFFSKAAGSASVSPVLVSSRNRPLALAAVSSMVFRDACTLGSSKAHRPSSCRPAPWPRRRTVSWLPCGLRCRRRSAPRRPSHRRREPPERPRLEALFPPVPQSPGANDRRSEELSVRARPIRAGARAPSE